MAATRNLEMVFPSMSRRHSNVRWPSAAVASGTPAAEGHRKAGLRRANVIPSAIWLAAAISLPLALPNIARLSWAQVVSPSTIDPRVFGFNIPQAPLHSGNGRRVSIDDENGHPVVAKIHVELDGNQILMLPDGRLIARPSDESQPTDRPFEPAGKEQIAQRLTASLQGFRTHQTRRYLYVYNTSEAFALVTSRILESMFPGIVLYAQAQKIEIKDPEVPLVVIMFRTEDQFQQYKRMPAGTIAYYDVVSNQIVMYEQSKLLDSKPQLAIQQAIATIAHEGVHQILNNIGVQQRLSVWPMWLAEGLAEYFAPTTTGERLNWKGAGQVNDMRMFELEHYLQGRSVSSPNGQLIDHTVTAARLTSAGYASAWALTHYLAQNQRLQFNRYVREVSRLGPLEGNSRIVGPGIIPDNLPPFKQHFGDDLADIERRLILHLKKLPYTDPFSDWPHFVALLTVTGGTRARRDAAMFHTKELAEKWIREALESLPDVQRRTVQTAIREFPNRAAAARFSQLWLHGP
jgi:hypothetical protein